VTALSIRAFSVLSSAINVDCQCPNLFQVSPCQLHFEQASKTTPAYILSTISGILLALSANVSDKTILSSSLFSDAFSMAKRKDIIRTAVELSLIIVGPVSYVIGPALF